MTTTALETTQTPQVQEEAVQGLRSFTMGVSMMRPLPFDSDEYIYGELYSHRKATIESIFLDAAATGKMDVMNQCIERGISVNMQDKKGNTALHHAAIHGQKEVVAMLLTHRDIDINLSNRFGNTPLMWAAVQGHLPVVEMLLERAEVMVNCVNIDKNTAMHMAVDASQLDVVKKLLAKNAQTIWMKNLFRQSPLTIAIRNNHAELINVLSRAMGVFHRVSKDTMAV